MRTILATAPLLVVIACTVLADGIGFNGDRVADHKTTVLLLTSNQLTEVAAKRESKALCRMVLTSSQQAQLVAEAGFAPTNVIVWSLASAKDTCTCDVLNMAIQFESDKVEIPHFLLGVDMDDRNKNFSRRLEEDRRAITNGAPNQVSQGTAPKLAAPGR